MRTMVSALLLCLVLASSAQAASPAPLTETLPAKTGEVRITFVGHASLMFEWQGKVIHVDPWTKQNDYEALPKADLLLITHEHRDHLDMEAVSRLRKDGMALAANPKAAESLPGAVVLRNGDTKQLAGIRVEAVPAYNLVHMRTPGEAYHPKGVGNGYVLHFGSLRVYVAGDTEDIPEMSALQGVDVAFLPVNLPFTMSPEMLQNAARLVQPKVLYPYHTGETDMLKVEALLKGVPGVETRIRPMK
jgi:L-ascorbate metabolism protein UlaG (beta-lactamase superfamily)